MTEELVEKRIRMGTTEDVAALFGNFDENLRTLEDELKCKLVLQRSRKFQLTSAGHDLVGIARDVIDSVRTLREAAASKHEHCQCQPGELI